MGENGCYPMIAYGTMGESEAFRNTCRSKGINFDEFNEVGKNIDKYKEDEKWKPIIEQSNALVGTVVSASVHPCFPKGNMVFTSNGYKEIQDVTTEDYVLTKEGYHKVKHTMINRSNDMKNITIKNIGKIRATGNHPFYVRKITKNYKNETLYTEPIWKSVNEFVKDDYVGIKLEECKNVIPAYDNIPTDKISFWWLIGRYIGDGWRKKKYKNRKHEYDVVICANKKDNETNEIKEKLQQLNFYNYWIEDANTTNKFHIQSKCLYEFLSQFKDGAINKTITKDVYDLPKEYIASFLEGYFSADGNVTNNRQTCTSISKGLIYGISKLVLLAYQKPCHIYTDKPKDCIIDGRLIHSDNIRYNLSYTINPKFKNYKIKDGYIWCKISSVEDVEGEFEVYNLEVEDVHSYTVSNILVHNCAFVLDNKDLLYEYGVVKIGDNLCVMITSSEADEYKVLKNDYLIVSVWELIDSTFKEIGKPIIDAHDLLKEIENDERIWKLYEDGITCTLNQVDSDFGTQLCQKYKPKNMAETSMLTAISRPFFDAWREQFLTREEFDTGCKQMNELLASTKGYICFQECLMQYFEWLGQSPSVSIGLIKKISKKKIKQEDFDKLEKDIKKIWIEKTGSEDMFEENWKMVQGCMSYGFCSSHAYSTALDMAYGAYLKVNYPLEYYTVCFNKYSNDSRRTTLLTKELEYFGIKLENVKYGYSKGEYTYDKQTNSIYKGIGSIKYINNDIGNELYSLRDKEFDTFVDLLIYLTENTQIGKRQIEPLIKINYFSQFGKNKKLDMIYEQFQKRYKKTHIDKTKKARKQELYEYENQLEDKPYTLKEQYKHEIELLGYPLTKLEKAPNNIYVVSEYDDKYGIKIKCYNIHDGNTIKMTMYKDDWRLSPIGLGSIIKFDTYMVKKNGDFRLKDYTIL